MHVGMYHAMFVRWLNVFPMSQIKVVLMEEYAVNRTTVLNDIFRFLDIGKKHISNNADLRIMLLRLFLQFIMFLATFCLGLHFFLNHTALSLSLLELYSVLSPTLSCFPTSSTVHV